MKIFAAMSVLAFSLLAIEAKEEYQLSSHILDIDKGLPAANVKIGLFKLSRKDGWMPCGEALTDANGRVKNFLPHGEKGANKGIYKLKYDVKPYFDRNGVPTFYPFIEVVFEISDDTHYHVPITLSPFGYSTYRGS